MKMYRNTNTFVLFIALTAVALIAATLFTGQLRAQDQIPYGQTFSEKDSQTEKAITVGTYNPQAAFEQHPLQEKLMEKYMTLQPAIQKAQQENDQQKAIQLQQEFEQERMQIIEQFQKDVDKALPEVAEAAGVKVIALEIAYIADDVKTQDVTAHLVEAFTENDENRPAQPQF